jgi:hypothetical protein
VYSLPEGGYTATMSYKLIIPKYAEGRKQEKDEMEQMFLEQLAC